MAWPFKNRAKTNDLASSIPLARISFTSLFDLGHACKERYQAPYRHEHGDCPQIIHRPSLKEIHLAKLRALDSECLAQFTGSQEFYRHPIDRDIICTQGARYLANVAQTYWLLGEIALAQRYILSVSAEGFQVWDLAICYFKRGHMAQVAAFFMKRNKSADNPPQ